MKNGRDTAEFREANRVYQNAWYHANKESALETRRKRIAKLRAQYHAFKATLKCTRCSEDDPVCLEFHHHEAASKDVDPSNLISRKGWTWERIQAELLALTVLCANCHRKEHARLRQEDLQSGGR